MLSAHVRQRLFQVSQAITAQALLSITNFGIGLLLIRYSTEADYGRYVLAYSALLLVTILPNALVSGPAIVVAGKLPRDQEASLVGDLFAQVRRWSIGAGAVVLVGTIAVTLLGWVNRADGWLAASVVFAGTTATLREHIRQMLYLYSATTQVILSDLRYAVLSAPAAGVAAYVFPGHAAAWVMLGLGIAAAWPAVVSFRALRRRAQWRDLRGQNVFIRLWPLGRWAILGAGINWSFANGFYFVMAAVLDVTSVAATGATRLLLMPAALLSNSVRQFILPLATRWYNDIGKHGVLGRLALVTLGLIVVALIYMGVVWLTRDWLLREVLGKQFDAADALLLAWGVTFVLRIARGALTEYFSVLEQFRDLSVVDAITAVVSLSVGYWAMLEYGAVGGVMGLAVAETTGLLLLSALAVRVSKRGGKLERQSD